jgi:hypothetical protein
LSHPLLTIFVFFPPSHSLSSSDCPLLRPQTSSNSLFCRLPRELYLFVDLIRSSINSFTSGLSIAHAITTTHTHSLSLTAPHACLDVLFQFDDPNEACKLKAFLFNNQTSTSGLFALFLLIHKLITHAIDFQRITSNCTGSAFNQANCGRLPKPLLSAARRQTINNRNHFEPNYN